MNIKVSRLMAYIYMPLIFTILGYSLAYFALSPVLEMLQAVGGMVIAQEAPEFNNGLKSIYDREASDVADSTSEEDQLDDTPIVISMEDIVFPSYETKYAHLSSDKIGLDAPVYWGDSKAVLKAGVGQYMGSSMPGFGKTILVSGHNTTFFKPFQKIEKGEILVYDTNYGRFKYQVTEIKVINEMEAASVVRELLLANKEKLVMYTCYPFETLVGRKTDRLFVFADKISGPTVE